MTKKTDTFSSNSLKILDKSLKEFEDKYIYNLSFYKKDKRAITGQKFHSLLCAYINDVPIKKLLLDLDDNEKSIWNKLIDVIKDKKPYFCYAEYPFLIKENLGNKFYYLTGRMDAISKENDIYTIYDWKTLNLPTIPENDLQTIVYLYCASKIFQTEKIKMKYFSIEKLNFIEIDFCNSEKYKKRIDEIIKKYYF